MTKLSPYLYVTGAILVLLGLVLYLPQRSIAPYLLIVGGLMLACAQSFVDERPNSAILRRLYNQRLIGHLLLFIAGGLMLIFPRGNEWILAITIAALLQVYTAFRIPALEKREEKK